MPLSSILTALLSDISSFCTYASNLPLRAYQLDVAQAIVDSVLNRRGLTFVVIFPRQSGKNELQAQIEAYLLAVLYLHDAEIVKISPTWKPQSLNAMRRLERVLQRNHLTCRTWKKEQGYIYRNGSARVFFLSGSPTANIIGATASTLLECDEAQDVSISKWDKEISPMAASTNATRVFWGTAWTSQTLLAREKHAALAAQQQDGIRRVFHLTASDVAREVPAYALYVEEQITRLGRSHPLIRTQYFSEETEPYSGMFPPSRRSLLLGSHPPLPSPLSIRPANGEEPVLSAAKEPGVGSKIFAFLLDIAGESPSPHSDLPASPLPATTYDPPSTISPPISYQPSAISSPPISYNLPAISTHDSTALTIVQIDLTTLNDPLIAAPRYLVVHRRQWTGASHTTLYAQILALAELWQPRHIVIDSTGIGAGLTSFLQRSLNPPSRGRSVTRPGHETVLPFLFTQKSKSDLGWDFLSIIETGRFKDHAFPPKSQQSPINYELPATSYELQSLFLQLEFCQMEILPGPDHRLRWGVPDSARDPLTGCLIHDDLLISASLCAVLDHLSWGQAASAVLPPSDPLSGLRPIY